MPSWSIIMALLNWIEIEDRTIGLKKSFVEADNPKLYNPFCKETL